MTSKKDFVVNYVLLEHTGRGCPVKARAGLYLNEVPQTKAQKGIIVPEYLSLVASVQQEAELNLGTGAGSVPHPVPACPWEHSHTWSGALEPLSKVSPKTMKYGNCSCSPNDPGLPLTAPKSGNGHLQSQSQPPLLPRSRPHGTHLEEEKPNAFTWVFFPWSKTNHPSNVLTS